MAKYRITTDSGTYDVTTDEPQGGAALGPAPPPPIEVHPPIAKAPIPAALQGGPPSPFENLLRQIVPHTYLPSAATALPSERQKTNDLEGGFNPMLMGGPASAEATGAISGAGRALPGALRQLLSQPYTTNPGKLVLAPIDLVKALYQGGKAGMSGAASEELGPQAQRIVNMLEQSKNIPVTAKPMANPVVGQAPRPLDLPGSPLAPPPSQPVNPLYSGPQGMQVGVRPAPAPAPPPLSSLGGPQGMQPGMGAGAPPPAPAPPPNVMLNTSGTTPGVVLPPVKPFMRGPGGPVTPPPTPSTAEEAEDLIEQVVKPSSQKGPVPKNLVPTPKNTGPVPKRTRSSD